MSDDLDVLWQPLKLRGATLPNRIMTTATTVQYGVAGMVNERHLHFYRERARGGVGLLFTEQLTATALSDTAFPTSILRLRRAPSRGFATRARGPRPVPVAVLCATRREWRQPRRARAALDCLGPSRGPSECPSRRREHASVGDVGSAQVTSDFARSARERPGRGLDGVEVHGAHGWLIGQFLSPFYNRRDDEYGGPRREPVPAGDRDRARAPLAGWRGLPGRPRADLRRAMGDAGITLEDMLAQLEVASWRRGLRLLRPLDRRGALRAT